MASLCLCHLMGLLSLFMADGFKLPDLWLLVQDGPRAVALPSLSRWNEAGQTGHESPALARVKRENKKVSNQSSAPVPTCCTNATITEATTKQTLLEKVVSATEASVESTTEPLTDPSTSLDLLEEFSTEVATSTEPMSTEPTTINHTASSHRADGQVNLSTVSTGTSVSQDLHAMDSTAPQRTSKKEEARPSKAAATLTKAEKALRLFNTTFSPTLATSGDSTATLRHLSGSTGPDSKQKLAPVNTTLASSTTATTATRTPKMDPSSGTPPITTTTPTTTLVRKCLLGIFLLALIASVFIITTAILATMLWRQKRAYKMNQSRHPTEMVCISSLLAAEEAEEAAERQPRIKRMKMLGCDGSETDIDNLTLNSFLP